MQLKILYTAFLILCLGALASSHECTRHPGGQSKTPLTIEKEEVMEFPLLRALYV